MLLKGTVVNRTYPFINVVRLKNNLSKTNL